MLKCKFTPDCVCNVDETGIKAVHIPIQLLFRKEKKVSKMTSDDRAQLITMRFNANVVGSYLPPFLMFPRQSEIDIMTKGQNSLPFEHMRLHTQADGS